MSRLRTVSEHVDAVLARVAPLPAVAVPLAQAAVEAPGLVLAADVVAAAPVPPFDHAAMDGYAVRRADVADDPVTLRVVGGVRAGEVAARALGPGDAARVMTGAPLPPGADAVVPVEHTSTGRFVAGRDGDEATVTLARAGRANIRRRGEDLEIGTLLAVAGRPVTPALVAAAAAGGVTSLAVHRRARVAVVSTGSELRAAGTDVGPGAIVDSNSLMLAALVRRAGAEPVRRGGVPDDAAALCAALDEAAAGADLVVTTGGVSAGAWDVVRHLLTDGAGGAVTRADLTGVAVRPGRPQALAAWRGVPWLALPGTPVSAFVSACLFVRPALDRLRGAGAPGLPVARRRVADGWVSRPGRVQVVPVRATADGVAPTGAGAVGGHALAALLDADALALVPAGADGVRAGEEVDVLLLEGAG